MATCKEWLDDVAAALSEGPLEISKVANAAPKPHSVKLKLKAALESQPERFDIRADPARADRWMVYLKREGASGGGGGHTDAPSFDALLQDVSERAELAHARHLDRDEHVRTRMEQLLRTKWPRASVAPFGSAASGLRVSSADIDLCVTFPDERGRHWDDGDRRSTSVSTIQTIAKLLRQSNAHGKVEPITRARVPIVKTVDSVARLACDVVPNAALALHNSRLLRSYGELEPLCRRLALLVKMWASRRGVSSAVHSYLSSYAHVVTVLHFCLARVSPPLLVDMQAPELVEGLPDCWCDGFDVRMCSLEAARSALDAKRRGPARPRAVPRAARLAAPARRMQPWPPTQSKEKMTGTLQARMEQLHGEAREVVEAALQVAHHTTGALANAVLAVALEESEQSATRAERCDTSSDTVKATGLVETPSLAALLRGFFAYMASLAEGKEATLAISLHERPLRSRAPVDVDGDDELAALPPYRFPKSTWPDRQSQIKEGFSIEDPFETICSRKPHDLCAPLNKQTTAILRSEYHRAATLLTENLTESGEAKPGSMGAANLLEEVLRSGSSPSKRRDEDGKAYSESEYIDYYGRELGVKRWASGALVDH